MLAGSAARIFAAIALLTAALTVNAQAATQKRVALVIGNSTYQNVAELSNPINDAKDVAQKLRSLSFDVILGTDLTRAQMHEAFQKFSHDVKDGDVGLFFYAGHGISLSGENFLIPVDMPSEIKVASEEESKSTLDGHLVNVADVIGPLQSAKLGMIFLDACRNTPSKEELGLQIVQADGATRKLRSLTYYRGISKLPSSATPTSGATGIFRAYATQPNNVSDDGDGRNSPFTKALLKHLGTPGLDVHQMMIKVRLDVQKDTQGRQVPWEESALTDLYYFTPQQQHAAAPPPNLPLVPPGATISPPEEGSPSAVQPRKGKAVFPSSGGRTKTGLKSKGSKSAGGGGRPKTASRGGGGRLPPGVGIGIGAGL